MKILIILAMLILTIECYSMESPANKDFETHYAKQEPGLFKKAYTVITGFFDGSSQKIEIIEGSGQEVYDVLDFLIPDNLILKLDKEDEEYNSQYIISNHIFENKWQIPTVFECKTWDKENIYVRTDACCGENCFIEYNYKSDLGTLFLKRKMKVGTVIKVYLPDSYAIFKNCELLGTRHTEYTIKLVAYHQDYYISKDMGFDDVIEVKWRWGRDDINHWEHFWYSRKYGWIIYQNKTDCEINYDRYFTNIVDGQPTLPDYKCIKVPDPESRYNKDAGIMDCNGRACFDMPATECPEYYPWCYAGACCR